MENIATQNKEDKETLLDIIKNVQDMPESERSRAIKYIFHERGWIAENTEKVWLIQQLEAEGKITITLPAIVKSNNPLCKHESPGIDVLEFHLSALMLLTHARIA